MANFERLNLSGNILYMKTVRYFLGAASFIFITQIASAQTNYVSHTLQSGETLSTLAKQYNTNVGDIMRMNGMHADTKLVYGSIIKIQSLKTTKKEIATEPPVQKQTTALPLNGTKHIVAKGETLFSISKKYNVSMEQLKTWNKLNSNSVMVGTALVVGNDVAKSSIPTTTEPKQKVETPQQTVAGTNTIPAPAPAETKALQPVANNNATTSSAVQVESNAIQQNSMNNNAVVADQQNAMVAAQDNTETSLSTTNVNGFFADMYQKNRKQKNISGMSKTFKTASGWHDNKYYVLTNDVDPGTIVKLTADNGNSIYAKVLWNMGDLKENSGLTFRVSDATAAALKENTDQFNLTLTY